ncbi:MAG: hypothetical protein JWP63_1522 [Candidatus Solibacter sp.]|nr:hypothetical protein [Candidatus Solibacter sp.]
MARAQAPAQQPPAQPQPPAQQPPAPPAETPQVETQRPIKLPPAPPQVVDVRMPGEGGWYFGLIGWLPVGQSFVDKGHAATFTTATKLQLAGTSKGAPGAEIGIAAGRHNSLRISYFQSKTSGTTTAPTDLVIFSQPYLKGDQLTTNAKLRNVKISYEYLTWPFPVESRHFRLKTLWQVQYLDMKTIFDAPIKSGTPDSTGAYTSYATLGSKSIVTPSIGLGVHEYASRNFRFEANVSGFALPHRFQLVDGDATIAYRIGHIELRAGAKAMHFRTSPKQDYFYRANLGGVFVGVRWYSE